jgi:hypothetical protein
MPKPSNRGTRAGAWRSAGCRCWRAAHRPGSRHGAALGTDLGEEAFTRPREVFRSGCRRTSLHGAPRGVAFSSRGCSDGGGGRISCATCHVSGTTNALLYVPGLSTHPGNFDTTSAVFNPKTDDGISTRGGSEPARRPPARSLRARRTYAFTAGFVRNVVVNRFAGANRPPIGCAGHLPSRTSTSHRTRAGCRRPLVGAVTTAEQRGRTLSSDRSRTTRAQLRGLPQPAEAFVITGSMMSARSYKTPTLLNANFNALLSRRALRRLPRWWLTLTGSSGWDSARPRGPRRLPGRGWRWERAVIADDVDTRLGNSPFAGGGYRAAADVPAATRGRALNRGCAN